MMAQKKKLDPGAKRNFLLVGGAVGVGLLLTLGSYMMFGGTQVEAPSDVSAAVSPSGAGSNAGEGVGQNPRFTGVVKDYNNAGAEQASGTGGSFVPIMPDAPAAPQREGLAFGKDPEPSPADINRPSSNLQPADHGSQMAQENRGLLDQQLQALFEQRWSLRAMPTKTVFVKTGEGAVQQAKETVEKVSSTKSAQATPDAAKKDLVAGALEVFPVANITPIDTDVPDRVYARVAGGRLAGADLYGGFTRKGEYVEVTYSLMRYQGKTYSINAVAMDPSNYRSVLSGDVDHKYFARYGAPILSAMLGAAAAAKADPGTQQVISSGTVVNAQPTRTSDQIIAAGVSAGATTLSQGLTAEKPEIAVKVPPGSFGVMFLADVFEPAS